MKRLALLALFATGCSSVLGFDDFTDTGSGSGSGGPKVRVTGMVTAWATGMAIADVGVEAANRDGMLVTEQTNTNAAGTYALNLPIVGGSADGYIHLSTAGYLDSYAHFPQPFTGNAQQDAVLFGGSDVATLHSQASAGTQTAGTGTMLVFAPPNSHVAIDKGTVYYISSSTGDLDTSLTAVALNGIAVVLNVPEGTVTPHTTAHASSRSYNVEPNTVVIVRLLE